MSGNSPNPVIATAREVRDEDDGIKIINGQRVRIHPVGSALITDVMAKIQDPPIPMWHNDAKDRDEPNPDDPNYLRDLEEVNRLRGVAFIDALCLFGVELIDGIPDDDGWVKKLNFMEKRGMLSLDGYDLDEELDREFLYKRYIIVDNSTIKLISEASGLTEEDIALAEESFRGN